MNDKKTYTVEISETLQRCIEITASSEEEAIEEVRKRYRAGEIVLYADDYKETEFNIATPNDEGDRKNE